MCYIFDTNIFRVMGHYYPNRFPTFWENLDRIVEEGKIFSCKEVFREIERQNIKEFVLKWAKKNKHIFLAPTTEEGEFIKEIFRVPHFRTLVGKLEQLNGHPVADPFVIALAKIRNGFVVTEESYKENSSRMPNICEHFTVQCVNLDGFMERKNWQF